mgnify:CR=1 FL=1
MGKLNSKIALVTGAASGIGRDVCYRFLEEDAVVIAADINSSALDALKNEAPKKGLRLHVIQCDITKERELETLISQAIKEHGHIDILVNNAGVAHIGKADTTPEADFDRVMSINVKGVYQCIAAAIPGFRANGSGVIINMASIAAWVGLADRFVYSTAKGAVMAMTLSVAKDYMHENIRCNSISPARVHTPFVDGFIAKNYPGKEAEMFEKLSASQPIGRMAQPEEVAALALYLASDEASFITGCDYPIDGGFIKLNN